MPVSKLTWVLGILALLTALAALWIILDKREKLPKKLPHAPKVLREKKGEILFAVATLILITLSFSMKSPQRALRATIHSINTAVDGERWIEAARYTRELPEGTENEHLRQLALGQYELLAGDTDAAAQALEASLKTHSTMQDYYRVFTLYAREGKLREGEAFFKSIPIENRDIEGAIELGFARVSEDEKAIEGKCLKLISLGVKGPFLEKKLKTISDANEKKAQQQLGGMRHKPFATFTTRFQGNEDFVVNIYNLSELGLENYVEIRNSEGLSTFAGFIPPDGISDRYSILNAHLGRLSSEDKNIYLILNGGTYATDNIYPDFYRLSATSITHLPYTLEQYSRIDITPEGVVVEIPDEDFQKTFPLPKDADLAMPAATVLKAEHSTEGDYYVITLSDAIPGTKELLKITCRWDGSKFAYRSHEFVEVKNE